MEEGKKINLKTLLDEIENYDKEIKNNLYYIFDFIYNEQNWPHKKEKIPRNKVALYKKIEELVG